MSDGLVHDYLLVLRGAERTFLAMADAWPEARIYSSLYDPLGMEGTLAERHVRTSYLRRFGVGQKGFRRLLPLFPAAVERLPVAGHDLLVSSSSAFAHGVRPAEHAVHVCYCHTPFRYAWHERDTALREAPAALRPGLSKVLDRIRAWDLEASTRVTRYVANAQITRERIQAAYGREAAVVHPPVAIERFTSEPRPEEWFLVVCELVAHKRVDLALQAAERAGVELRVVGEGPQRAAWERRFPRARFLGRVGDRELEALYGRARAMVVPNTEEFGIAAVEAQAAGRPVLATAAGGATETVLDGATGLLVEPNVDAFATAMDETTADRFDPATCRENAKRFSTAEFQRKLRAEVEAAVSARRSTAA